MFQSEAALTQHLAQLKSYLEQEQPALVDLVDICRLLDQVAYGLGLLPRTHSFADQIGWWPLISVLGTFSAGKSTFINDYLEFDLQRTGHQAVDDRFTVIAYAPDGHSQTLPGSALDADPRFPFYLIGREIEQVAKGEGRRLDSYIQLKTCPSTKLKGTLLLDSPGFDADEQRTATLSITDRIIERSDLVLVFFDAHRPEPGAIRDTLQQLVENVISRHDASKFVYILNQIDVTADENNLEDVVAAWQRALAHKGLTAGRFYRIFSQTACTHIRNEAAAQRLLDWREQDMRDLGKLLESVAQQRNYRIADRLRRQVREIEARVVPELRQRLADRRRWVLIGDGIVLGLAGLVFVIWLFIQGSWEGLSYTQPAVLEKVIASPTLSVMVTVLLAGLFFSAHASIRRLTRRYFRPGAEDWVLADIEYDNFLRAYDVSTSGWRSILSTTPSGWGWLAKRRLSHVLKRVERHIQALNDQHL